MSQERKKIKRASAGWHHRLNNPANGYIGEGGRILDVVMLGCVMATLGHHVLGTAERKCESGQLNRETNPQSQSAAATASVNHARTPTHIAQHRVYILTKQPAPFRSMGCIENHKYIEELFCYRERTASSPIYHEPRYTAGPLSIVQWQKETNNREKLLNSLANAIDIYMIRHSSQP